MPPPPPLRGGYAFSGFDYGSTVTYDCECGYELLGEQTNTCGSTGDWGVAPCCKRECLIRFNSNFNIALGHELFPFPFKQSVMCLNFT